MSAGERASGKLPFDAESLTVEELSVLVTVVIELSESERVSEDDGEATWHETE